MEVREQEIAAETPGIKKEGAFTKYIAAIREKGVTVRGVWTVIAMFATAAVLSRTSIWFGAVPLGIGFFCAATVSLPAAMAGIALGAATLGSTGLIWGAVYLLCLTVRLVFSMPGQGRRALPDCEGYFRERPELRMSAACVGGLGAAVYQAAVGGLTVPSLCFGAMMVVGATLSCGLFSTVFDSGLSAERLSGESPMVFTSGAHRVFFDAGILALGAALTWGLYDVSLFGMSLGLIFAAAMTLYIARRRGPVSALVSGCVCTLAAVPLYAPAFGFLGVICGVLWQVGGFFAIGLGIGAAAVWTSFVGGLPGFLSVFPEIAATSIVAWPLLARMGRKRGDVGETGGVKLSRDVLEEMKSAGVNSADERIMRLSGAFSSLSKVLGAYRTSTPDPAACGAVCSEACGRVCTGCDKYAACWEGDGTSAEAFSASVVGRMNAGEPLDDSLVTEDFREACPSTERLLEEVRTAAGEFLSALREQARSETAVTDYEMVAGMLRDAVRADRAAHKEDARLTAEVKKIFRSHGCRAESVSVIGQRRKSVLAAGFAYPPSEAVLPGIRREIEAVCGSRMSEPALIETDGQTTLRMDAIPKLDVDCAVSMRAADAEGVSGDSVRFFDSGEETKIAVLSDGMGTGEEAAETSGICGVFLEKMIGAGCGKATAVRMLNSLLRTGGRERSATLDMAEIDLLYGDAVFLKSGAAPSYVKRGSQLFRIRSKTIPLGLMKAPDTERVRFRLEPGDRVILFSDGVGQGEDDDTRLTALLSADWGDESPRETADRLLAEAAAFSEKRDDMTVALLTVSEK